MRIRTVWLKAAVLCAALGAPLSPGRAAQTGPAPGPVTGPVTGHVTGVGGVFVTSKNPKALAAWYRDVLGLDVKNWGGALLPYDAPGHPPMVVWSPFRENSEELAGSRREFMLNLAVDDMDAMVARLTARGVPILKRQQDENGKFAWILDPDGTKIELWQPK